MHSGWREVALADVCTDKPGKYLSADSYEGGGPYPVFGSNSIMGSHSEPLYQGPMVVMAGQGAYAGSVRFVAGDAWVNNNAFALFPDPNLIHPYYLYLLLEIRIDPRRYRAGTGQPYVKKGLLREQRFPLPLLDVQRRTVDLISSIDQAIQSAETLALSSQESWKGVVESLDLDLAGDRLADVVSTAKAGGTPSRKKSKYYGGDIPWLKSGEVDSPQILSAEESITEEGLGQSSAWLVPRNSVLVAMYGATAGAVGFLASEMATNQAVLALVGDPARVSQRFLFHWLRSRTQSMKSRATGAAQPNLSKSRVLEEPFPSLPIERQRLIAETLDSILHTSARAETLVLRLKHSRHGLLNSLVSGEHRIPDSYDRLLEEAS